MMPSGFSGNRVESGASALQTRQVADRFAGRRSQSMPQVRQRHSSGVRGQTASSLQGQVKRPRCRRRTHSQTPVPSQTSNLIRWPSRLRNAQGVPSQGERPSACGILGESPSMPIRTSTGSTASQTCSGRITSGSRAATGHKPPPATPARQPGQRLLPMDFDPDLARRCHHRRRHGNGDQVRRSPSCRRHSIARSGHRRQVAAPVILHPAPNHVRVEALRQRNRRHRHARLAARFHHLSLELLQMPPMFPPLPRLLQFRVHVPTKNARDTIVLHSTAGGNVGRMDAYPEFAPMRTRKHHLVFLRRSV